MKKAIITLSLIMAFTVIKAQPKKDTIIYTFTEKQITLLDQLLMVGDQGVASSDNYSRNQWKEYHTEVLKLDSIIRVQYNKFHPQKSQPKTDKK